MTATSSSLLVTTADDWVLRGKVWSDASATGQNLAVIVNGGAGVLAKTYDPFAAWLASNGIETITYDYRGIGDSATGSLRGIRASVLDWGSKDCAAIVNSVRARYGRSKRIAIVGHSVGCFLTGFLEDPEGIEYLVFIAGHTGYWKDYDQQRRWRMFWMWHVLAPAVARLWGYFPARVLGLPADIPKEVSVEWAARLNANFWQDRPARRLPSPERLADRFSAFYGAGLLVNPPGDPFATARASGRLIDLYSNCKFEKIVISADDYKNIGHFGFFKPRMFDTLWPLVGNWFVRNLRVAS